ncbi:MAG TPA: hypothetical protein VI318_19465 [Baekduia sp.]
MRKRLLPSVVFATAILVAFAFATSAVARGRWAGPIAVPAQSAGGVIGAVDDRGRATLAYPGARGPRLGRFGPGARLGTVALANLDGSSALALAPDGTAIGVGTRFTPDPAAPDVGYDPHDDPCCSVPVVYRWTRGAGAVPVTADVAPALQAEYAVRELAVQPDGAAVFVAEPEGDGFGGSAFTLARIPPGGGTPVLRTVTDAATDILLAPGGATAAWRADDESPTFRRLTLDGGLAAAPDAVRSPWRFDGQVALDGRGRVVRVSEMGRRVTVSFDGGAEHAVTTVGSDDDVVDLAAGADGTVAVAVGVGGRLRVGTVDPRGHVRRGRTVGRLVRGGGFALAVDGRGGVHVAWRESRTVIAVRGPGGTRRFRVGGGSDVELGPLAVSARGGVLVVWYASGRSYAAAAPASP